MKREDVKREDVKREDVKREDVKRKSACAARWAVFFTFHVITFHALTAPALAQPTQEEVLKSIGDNVGQPVDSRHFVAALAGIAGVVVLLVVAGRWRTREGRPRGLNHHGRLMKEVLRHVPLKRADKPPGEWNDMGITLRGDVLSVTLNGELVIRDARLPGLPARGPIGPRHEHGAIQFKDLRIRELAR